MNQKRDEHFLYSVIPVTDMIFIILYTSPGGTSFDESVFKISLLLEGPDILQLTPCPAKPLIWSEGDRVAAAAKDTDCAGCP